MQILTDGWKTPHPKRRHHLPMKEVEIVTAFYGHEYAELFERTCLPSILRQVPSNVKPVFRVYTCPPYDVPIYKALGSLNFEIITDPNMVIDGNHDSLAVAYTDSILRGVPTLQAPADMIWGLGAFELIDRMQPGDVVVAAQARIDQSQVSLMENLLKENRDNAAFVKLCLETIPHDMVKRGKNQDPSQLWRFKSERCIQFADPPPIAWWGQPWMLEAWSLYPDWVGQLGVIDHQLPDLAYSKGHLIAVQDSRDFFWAEWTDPSRRVLPVPGGLKTEAMKLLDRLDVRLYHN